MRKLLVVIFVIIFLSISTSVLSDIIIIYKSGECNVDLYGTGKWKDAEIDMELNEGSVIKTGTDGEIEIEMDGEMVAIGKDTKVSISKIMVNLKEKKKLSWFSKLPSVFKNLVREKADRAQVTLMGVRGEADDEGDMDWMGELEEEDPISMYKSAVDLYEEGEYAEAINIFKNIIDSEDVSHIREEIAYYLGSSMFNNMQYEESVYYLEESLQDKEAYYYEIALLNVSFANYFLKDYPKAIKGFKRYTVEFANGGFEPHVLLMLGKSHKAVGEDEKAKSYFNEIVTLHGNTEVHADAVDEMKRF